MGAPVMLFAASKERVHYPCRCDCGHTAFVLAQNLLNGSSYGCGCDTSGKAAANRKHGDHASKLYRRWCEMRKRCKNPRHRAYKHYGGRGIKVCDAWHDWLVFKEWATQNGFSEELSLDRINNDGPYSPENCRWVSQKTQCRNTRQVHLLTAFGETKSVVEWAEDPRCAVPLGTLAARALKDWPDELMITLPNVRGQRIAKKP